MYGVAVGSAWNASSINSILEIASYAAVFFCVGVLC